MRKVLVILFLCSLSSAYSQTDSMSYFLGTWKFETWFANNKSKKPDIKATWKLTKVKAAYFSAEGSVIRDGKKATTHETMFYDEKWKEYVRAVFVDTDGTAIFLRSKGWKNGKVLWEGNQVGNGGSVAMKEEITRISDKEFHAVFYRQVNGKWEEMTREVLTRVQ